MLALTVGFPARSWTHISNGRRPQTCLPRAGYGPPRLEPALLSVRQVDAKANAPICVHTLLKTALARRDQVRLHLGSDRNDEREHPVSAHKTEGQDLAKRTPDLDWSRHWTIR
jgi:hypothetical protein